MKRLFVLMVCAAVLGGCASKKPVATARVPVKVAPVAAPLVDINGAPIERIPFRAGVSSVTVENLAKAQGCVGGQGAGLTTPQGPVEVYRMICDSRRVFMARCEFRQCVAIATPQYVRPRESSYMPVAVAQPAHVVTSPVSVPADSRVVLATPAAPQKPLAYAAPVAASAVVQSGTPSTLSSREVPTLAIVWNCGECTKNPKAAPLIVATYEKAAKARGFSVSSAETATMTITHFRQRSPGVRVMFGILAGHDAVSTQIVAGDKTFTVNEVSRGWGGIDSVLTKVGTNAFTSVALGK